MDQNNSKAYFKNKNKITLHIQFNLWRGKIFYLFIFECEIRFLKSNNFCLSELIKWRTNNKTPLLNHTHDLVWIL